MTTISISLSLIFDKGFWKELNVIIRHTNLIQSVLKVLYLKGV